MIINRTVPQKGESLASYLFRIGAENYCTIGDIERQLNLTKRNIWHSECSPAVLDKICSLVNHAREHIYPMTINSYFARFGNVSTKNLISKSTVKYCPSCISEQPVHKLVWMIRPITICQDHRTILVDRCDGCGSTLEIKDLMMGYCPKCAHPLVKSKGISVQRNSWLFRSQRDIQERLEGHRGNGIGAHYNFADYVTLANHSFHLIQGLNSFIQPKPHVIQAFQNQKKFALCNYDLAISYGNIHWMFQYPEHFYQVLTEFDKKHHDIKFEQKNQFEMLFHQGGFADIRGIYESHWVSQLDLGGIRKDFSVFKKRESLLEKRMYISKEEAKERLRVTANRLGRFQKYASLEVKNLKRGQRSLHLVNVAKLKTIMNADEAFVTRTKAAQILGIHVNTVRELIKDGFLSEEMSMSGQLLIAVEGIRELIRSCIRMFRSQSRGLRLHDAIVKYRLYGLTLNELLRLIQTGRVSTTTDRRVPKLVDIYVNENHLYRCIRKRIKQRQQKHGYTLDEARQILGVRDRTLKEMVDRGVIPLKNRSIENNGREHWRFDKQFIDNFARDHIRLQQAADKYQIPRHLLYRWIRQGVICNYNVGVTRRPLLRHNEIKQAVKKHGPA